MLQQVTKQLDQTPLRVRGTGGPIRGLVITNNTPGWLYVGLDQRVTRETALVVVEPFTLLSVPVNASELWVLDGHRIGNLTVNARASVQYGPEPVQLAQVRLRRNYQITFFENLAVAANASTSATFSSQSVGSSTAGGSGSGSGTGTNTTGSGNFTIPSAATRRTLYIQEVTGTLISRSLEADMGSGYYLIDNLAGNYGTRFDNALPEKLRITLTGGNAGATVSMYLMVDL